MSFIVNSEFSWIVGLIQPVRLNFQTFSLIVKLTGTQAPIIKYVFTLFLKKPVRNGTDRPRIRYLSVSSQSIRALVGLYLSRV